MIFDNLTKGGLRPSPTRRFYIMTRHTKRTFKGVLVIIGIGLLFTFAFKACDTSIAVSKNAVIIPGECIVINYDATPEEFDAAKAAWLETLKDYPAKGIGHTTTYR
jgi:hypothetical protein